jgi:hypothetical protein
LNWAKKAKQLKFDFHSSQCTTHRAQIKHIKKLALQQSCHPEIIQLVLPGDGKVITVTRFLLVATLAMAVISAAVAGISSGISSGSIDGPNTLICCFASPACHQDC